MEPYVRKIIIVDERFLEDLGRSSVLDLDEFSNPGLDTKIVSLPLRSSEDIAELTRIMDVSVIRPGSIVVKPDYTNQFVKAESFSEDIVLRKYGLFVQLCHALGAKKVSISDIKDVSIEESDDAKTSAELHASAPLGSIAAGFDAEKSSLKDDIRKSIMEIKTEAQGGQANIEAAEKLIDQYGLHRDALFTDLTNMCRIESNKLSRHEIYLDLSKDVKKVFDSSIQSKIKVMAKFYDGSAEFERTKKALEKNRTATKLSIVVEF